MILSTLVLLPVMAHAQAGTSTAAQTSPSSATFQAELTQPAIPAKLAMKAAAAPAASIATLGNTNHAAIREFIQTRMTENFADAALIKGGTFEFAIEGSAPTESSAPKITRAVEVSLSTQELEEQPAVSNVVVHAIVDENGVPRNVSIAQSAGSLVDSRAIEAVSQYRFKPATLDNRPTWASVSIAIKIQKP
jgi:TonB family protein